MNKTGKILFIPIVGIFICFGVITWLIRVNVNNLGLPVITASDIVPGNGNVLVVFPHADDEVGICGTLAMLQKAGIQTNYLCLTRGEEGRKSGNQSSKELIQERTEELKNAANILGISTLVQDTFPDSDISNVPDSLLKSALTNAINRFKPETIITYDDKKGLYGHLDHIHTARAVIEVCQASKNSTSFSVNQVISLTQPQKIIKLYLKYSKKFNKRFYKVNKLELPNPEFAINTFKARKQKEKLLVNYEKRKIISSLMPHKKWMPNYVFHFIHDREYFHYSWSKD